MLQPKPVLGFLPLLFGYSLADICQCGELLFTPPNVWVPCCFLGCPIYLLVSLHAYVSWNLIHNDLCLSADQLLYSCDDAASQPLPRSRCYVLQAYNHHLRISTDIYLLSLCSWRGVTGCPEWNEGSGRDETERCF